MSTRICNSTVRQKRLGRAHTTARQNVARLLDSLSEHSIDQNQIFAWQKRLNELDLAIIRVDWQKSDAELEHARQNVEMGNTTEKDFRLSAKLEQTNLHIQGTYNHTQSPCRSARATAGQHRASYRLYIDKLIDCCRILFSPCYA